MKLKSILLKALLVLISTMVTLAVVEISIRIFWKPEPVFAYGYPRKLFIPDPLRAYKYRPNFRGSFRGESYGHIRIETSSKGLRDVEHGSEKTGVRILGLGDSVTFGAGVEFEHTYLRLLEKKLLANGYKVDIVKTGVNGYEFEQEYRYFFEEGYKFHPDIVTVGVVLNDVRQVDILKRMGEKCGSKARRKFKKLLEENDYEHKIALRVPYEKKAEEEYQNGDILIDTQEVGNLNGFVEQYKDEADSQKRLASWFQTSRAFEFAYKRLQSEKLLKSHQEKYFDIIYKSWSGKDMYRFAIRLLSLHDYLDERGATLVLILFPYTEQFKRSLNFGDIPQRRIKAVAAQKDIRVVDLLELLDTKDYAKYYLPNDRVHLNGDGYRIVSDHLYDVLTKDKLLRKRPASGQ